MLAAIDSYSVLLLVPLMCVPVQLLYLKSGQRYDLGAVTYIAAGAFFAASWSGQIDRDVALKIAVALLFIAFATFFIRCLAIAFGRPADFTLVSLGQLWATPALIDYELQKITKASGVSVAPLNWNPTIVALGVCGLAAASGYFVTKSELPDRLVALTESPLQYCLLFGSPVWLAIRLETVAALTYFAAGILVRLIMNDLSPDAFGMESIWCVLAAAPMARASGVGVLAGPFVATGLRYSIKSTIPPKFATMAVYAVLAAVLAFVVAHGEEASRDVAA